MVIFLHGTNVERKSEKQMYPFDIKGFYLDPLIVQVLSWAPYSAATDGHPSGAQPPDCQRPKGLSQPPHFTFGHPLQTVLVVRAVPSSPRPRLRGSKRQFREQHREASADAVPTSQRRVKINRAKHPGYNSTSVVWPQKVFALRCNLRQDSGW